MLKSWDFVDPRLAGQLTSLNKELDDLKEQKMKILKNARLSQSAKEKLLSYNE